MKTGLKIPDWKIIAIQKMFEDGKSLRGIANELNLGETTVGRYCQGLKRKPLAKMGNGERRQLLDSWK